MNQVSSIISLSKIIAGLGLAACAVAVGVFAFVSFGYWGNVCLACIPIAFSLSLACIGAVLIRRWKARLPNGKRILIITALGAEIISSIFLNLHIRSERKSLQSRAKDFLSRPVPIAFNTNELGGYIESRGPNVLTRARTLIERYANNGRIRWSARIQAQMATAPFGMAACEEVAKTPEERRYVADCRDILDAEWRMGFWQWVEDTMELKSVIPEIEEEDEPSKRPDARGLKEKGSDLTVSAGLVMPQLFQGGLPFRFHFPE